MRNDVAVWEIINQHGLGAHCMASAFVEDEDDAHLPVLEVAVKDHFVL